MYYQADLVALQKEAVLGRGMVCSGGQVVSGEPSIICIRHLAIGIFVINYVTGNNKLNKGDGVYVSNFYKIFKVVKMPLLHSFDYILAHTQVLDR